jgi:hypothetical protein
MRTFITIIIFSFAFSAFVLAEPSERSHYIDKSCTDKETWSLIYGQMRDLLQLTVKLLRSDQVPEDILNLVNRLFNIQWKVNGQTNRLWSLVIGMHRITYRMCGTKKILSDPLEDILSWYVVEFHQIDDPNHWRLFKQTQIRSFCGDKICKSSRSGAESRS